MPSLYDIDPDEIERRVNERMPSLYDIDPDEIERRVEEKMRALGYDPSPEAEPEESTAGHVLQILGYLDRPRNALATGVANLQDYDPETTFLSGLGEGISGGKKTSWGDVVGIENEWAKLGLDIVADPLNFIPGLGFVGKGGKVGKAIQKPASWLYGSTAGKLFGHSLPSEYRAVEEGIQGVLRKGSDVPLIDAARAADKELTKLLKNKQWSPEEVEAFIKARQFSPKEAKKIREAGKLSDEQLQSFREQEIFEALERPDAVIPGVDAEMRALLRPLQDLSLAKHKEKGVRLEKFGVDPKAPIDELGYEFMPRKLSGKGRYNKAATLKLDKDAFKQEGRKYFNWYDEEGSLVTTGAVGRKSSGGVYVDKDGVYRYGQKAVEPRQATKMDLKKAGLATRDEFIEDPIQALFADASKKQNRINFLNILSELTEQGVVRGDISGALRPTEKTIRVPGLGQLAAPKPVANRVENLAHALYDPESFGGQLEQFLGAIWKTRVGQNMRAYTSWWKRNMLALHPGFHVANTVSNLVLVNLAGVTNPYRVVQAGMVQAGGKGKVMPGITNEVLKQEFRLRNLIDTQQMALAGGLDVRDPLTKAQQMPFMEKYLGKRAAQTGEKWAKLNDKAFKVGTRIEENSRLAVAIDYLKKNVKGTPTAEELDRAAMHAKAYLFDYGDLTSFEKVLKNYAPFYAWYRNIIGKTLVSTLSMPHKLAHQGRFFDFILEPLSADDYAIADPWLQEMGPVDLGGTLDRWFGTDLGQEGNVGLSGRFIPYGTVEQAVSRPQDQALGMINPLLKAPLELLGNWDYFKGRPIDEVAGSGLEAAANPITGGPYSLADEVTFPGVQLPAMAEQALQWTPASRYLHTLSTLSRGSLYEDPYRPEMTAGEKGVWWGTGGKAFPLDRGKMLHRRKKEAGRKEAAIERKRKYALRKGDFAAARHYAEQLRKERESSRRARTSVESGT